MNLKFFASYRDFDQQFLLPSPFSKKCCIPQYDPPSPICLPLSQEGFQKEVDNITYLAETNNYHIDIQNLIRKKRITHTHLSKMLALRKVLKVGYVYLSSESCQPKFLKFYVNIILSRHSTLLIIFKIFFQNLETIGLLILKAVSINWNVETVILFVLDRLDVIYSRESMSMKMPGEKSSLRNQSCSSP